MRLLEDIGPLIRAILASDGNSESAAENVARHFAAAGIQRSEIDGGSLSALYAELREAANPPAWNWAKSAAIGPCQVPLANGVCGVIVETRANPALEFVVGLFAQRLNIPIQLFHGRANEAFIRASPVARLVRDGQVLLTQLDAEGVSSSELNALLLSSEFWHAMAGRKKILVFQPDTILCSRSEFALRDFLDFDYIGSTWRRKRPTGLVTDGGSGGLSLRDWGKSVACLQRFPPHLWRGGEDGYFAFHLELMGARVGRPDDCARFSTQSEFAARSFGAHQISLLSRGDLTRFLDYCPEAAFMLSQSGTANDPNPFTL